MAVPGRACIFLFVLASAGRSSPSIEAFRSPTPWPSSCYRKRADCFPAPRSKCRSIKKRPCPCSRITGAYSGRHFTSSPDSTCSTALLFLASESAGVLNGTALNPTDPALSCVDPKDGVPNYKWTSQTVEIALPALIGMIADPMLSLMDTGYVGRLGAIPLAALGACTSIFHLAFNAFRATTTATTSLVASALAHQGRNEKDNEAEARVVIDTSLRLGLAIGVMVAMTLLIGWSSVLGAMGITFGSPLLQPAKSYLQLRALAAPAVLLITVAEGAFRGYGNTRIPLLASFLAAAVNAILDPVLMFSFKMYVGGAAAATAISQVCAASLYWVFLRRRRMLPQSEVLGGAAQGPAIKVNKMKIVTSILNANLAMMAKQGSLLLGWAYATAKATRLGHYHVGAHQVALSFWLIFAFILDGTAVSAQVLMSRCNAEYESNAVPEADERFGRPRRAIHSLTRFMITFSLLQGLASTAAIFILGKAAPAVFTTDPTIREYLKTLIPHLAWQQLLVSCTLVMESLAVGGNKFRLLAAGTVLSTYTAMVILRRATSIVEIWSNGIVALFIGRLATATIGVLDLNGAFDPVRQKLSAMFRTEHVDTDQ